MTLRMKNEKFLKMVLIAAVLIQGTGALFNGIVKSLNRGMPIIGYTAASGKYVPINPGTKLVFLADVIPVGNYIFSAGDLFFLTGVLLSLVALWVALPQGRKFLPFLVISIIGIILSVAQPNDMKSTLLCETAAAISALGIYWSYFSDNKEKNSTQPQPSRLAKNTEYSEQRRYEMGCLCREGEKECIWWVTREFNEKSKGYCANPNIVIQTKITCDGNNNRYFIKREGLYSEAINLSKENNVS